MLKSQEKHLTHKYFYAIITTLSTIKKASKMKTYSIIWDGREKAIAEQIDFVTKWARNNRIPVKYWRDKTIQQRVCQYVGSPKIRSNWGRQYLRSLTKKYTILQMSDGQLANFKQLVGKSFSYDKSEQKKYMSIDAFTILQRVEKLAKDYSFKSIEQKFNSDEELKTTVEQTKLAKNQMRDWDHFTNNGYRVWTETITTTHKAKLTPWVVLDDDSLEKVGSDITTSSDVDTAPLLAREKELIDIYNENNVACGRLRGITKGKEELYSPEILLAYQARETARKELYVVSKTLGAVKRKLTLASKREGGIEYDLTPLSLI